MHRIHVCAALCALLFVPGLVAQSSSSTDMVVPAQSGNSARLAKMQDGAGVTPFSRMALGGGISVGGVNLQAAVNVSQHLNIRGVGNFFQHTVNDISTNGFNATGKINLATAGVSLDYFPWARHGFRLSPGVLFLNQNAISGTMVAQGGTSFTLNDVTYYSSKANPVTGTASLDLHSIKASPTMTLGWGNMIPRNGGHWSFPVELGVAYTGKPNLAMALVSGKVCTDPAGTLNCQNVVGDPSLNANLQAEVAKDQKDLEPLRFYPVISFGVAFSFGKSVR